MAKKVREDRGLKRKPRMERRSCVGMWRRDEGKGAQECMERQTEKSDFWRRALESKNYF